MNNNLPDEINKILENITSTEMEFDLDVDTIINIMYFKLRSMNVSTSAMEHFALTLKKDKNNYIEAMGGAILSDIINSAVKTMIEFESNKNDTLIEKNDTEN